MDRTNGMQKAARGATFIAVAAVVVSLIMSVLVFDSADGKDTSRWGTSEYSNEIITGNTADHGGWDEDIFYNVTGSDQQSATADTFMSKIGNISNELARWLGMLTVLIVVLRFALRGVYEMAFRQDNKGKLEFIENNSIIGTFIATSDERTGSSTPSKMNSGWVVPMLKETFWILLLVFGIWVLLSIIAGIVIFALSNIIGSGQDAGLDVGNFSAGGIDVTTTR